MSKPFMFHFTAKLYTIFYSRNFFRNFFLEKAKKISPRKQKLSLLWHKDSVFHVKKEAHSPVNVSTSYVLGVYFVGSRHPF